MLGTASSLRSTSALVRPTCSRPLSSTIAPPPATIGTATLRPLRSASWRTAPLSYSSLRTTSPSVPCLGVYDAWPATHFMFTPSLTALTMNAVTALLATSMRPVATSGSVSLELATMVVWTSRPCCVK